MIEEACQIDSGSSRCFCAIHRPDGKPKGSLLFCYPFFEERKSAQRVMVEAARDLCAQGFGVIRFDYRGCGDSQGSFDEFSVPDWLGDIQAVAGELNKQFPDVPAGILGLRLGAAFALRALAEPGAPRFEFAVLWEPVLNGREHLEHELRRKLMKEMMTFGRSRVTRETLLNELGEGGTIDFDGYAITSALHRDISALDLFQLRGGLPPKTLTLAIGPSERVPPGLARFNDFLREAGVCNELRVVREQPFWNLVGMAPCPELIRLTTAWVKQATGGG